MRYHSRKVLNTPSVVLGFNRVTRALRRASDEASDCRRLKHVLILEMIQFPPYPETDIAEYRYRVRQVPFSD
jgi:hypothetical protein